MHYADEFILLDVVQYRRKGWMSRNRILKPEAGWQYIKAGAQKPPFQALISDVLTEEDDQWKQRILRQLNHYKKSAPYFHETIDLVNRAITSPASTLSHLNKIILETIRDYLDIDCDITIFSEQNIAIENVEHAGQWALRIAQAINAREYVNPINGRNIFNLNEFSNAGIQLRFIKHRLPHYDQKRMHFEEALSIIDVLMFNSVKDTRIMLSEYDLLQ